MNASTTPDALHASALKALGQALPIARREELATAQQAQFVNGACRAGVLLQSAAHGTQLGALRYMFADGRTPIALMPSTAAEFFELFAFADSVARLWNIPATLAVEPELLADMASAKSPSSPPTVAGDQRAAPLPLPLGQDSELMRWQHLVRANAEKLALTRLNRQPEGDAKVDWLVVSYGVTAQAAQAAVNQAREKGLGVDHLVLQTLSPLPERAMASAAMGKRFVVVAERNFGQLHPEIQRLCPSLPCVLVSDGLSHVQPAHVLNALMRFPRCC